MSFIVKISFSKTFPILIAGDTKTPACSATVLFVTVFFIPFIKILNTSLNAEKLAGFVIVCLYDNVNVATLPNVYSNLNDLGR